MLSIAPLVQGRPMPQSQVMEVDDMQSPYLTQILAEAHVEDLRRSAGRRSASVRRRPRHSALPRLRDWWAGQLRRPAGGTARTAVIPGRPAQCTSGGGTRSARRQPRPAGPVQLGGGVKGMAFIWWRLAVVAVAALALFFSSDSRPGVEGPPQGWFGRR